MYLLSHISELVNSLRFVICLNTRRGNVAGIMADAVLLVYKFPHLRTFLSHLDKVKVYFFVKTVLILSLRLCASLSLSLNDPLRQNKFVCNFHTSISHLIFQDLICQFKKLV